MAKCPKCGYKLQLIDVRAECPICKTNIPNYDFEGQLERDAIYYEKSWSSFRKKTKSFKRTVIGTKARIVGLAFSLIPLVIFVIPLASVHLNLPYNSGTSYQTLLSIILDVVDGSIYDISSFLSFISFDISGTSFILLFVSIILLAIGIVVAVINFFAGLIGDFFATAKPYIICNTISSIFFAAAIIVGFIAGASFSNSIGDLFYFTPSASAFVGLAMFVFNAILYSRIEKNLKVERAELKD